MNPSNESKIGNLFKSYIEQEELHDKSNNEKNKIFLLFKEYFKSIMTGLVECLESAEQESKIKNKN